MASEPGKLLNRLIGLETEYATVLGAAADVTPTLSRATVYRAICEAIAREQPTAIGRYDTATMFLASGGAIAPETSLQDNHLPGGLIEGATPEVRSPQVMLDCQRAQDRMLQRAAEQCGLDVEVRILKNNCDRFDHVYGCQENYEADVATGLELALYRLGIVALVPLQLVYIVSSLAWILLATGVLGAVRVLLSLLGLRWPTGEILFADPPPTGLRLVVRGVRLLQLPLVTGLSFLTHTVAFRRQRKHLTGFLMSRLAITGSGHVDSRGKYWLSAKAMAIDCHTAMGSYRGERPMFVFRHWLEQICGQSFFSLSAIGGLLRQRQRLQIGLSDSNIADMAEYLKVGTTSLVLDMIEAGWAKPLPVIRQPVAALHRIAGDWNLISRVPTSQGPMSALELQSLYLHACRRFVLAQGDAAPEEAHTILQRWEESLDAAIAFRADERNTSGAIGKIDWLTKRWMLDQLSPSATWEVRKKVDLRYHELSADSYFDRVSDAMPATILTCEGSIERASRMPPNDSPAGRRGHLIREFCGGDEALRVSWSHVVIGHGRARRVVTIR